MKKLTLDLWEKIVDAFYKKSQEHTNMVGIATKDQVENYLGFYGVHNSVYWSEQDGQIRGVSTAHPGIRDFDWNWGEEDGIWTAHVVWADNVEAHAEVLQQFLRSKHPVKQLYTWRNEQAVPLTARKLERILSYGRRSKNNSCTATTGSELSGVDAEHLAGSGGDGSPSLRSRGYVPASVCTASGEEPTVPRAASPGAGCADVSAGRSD